MNNNLQKCKLGDCIDFVIDNRGKTPKKLGGDWSNSGYRVISALNVHNGFIDNEDQIRFVSEEIYSKWMRDDVIKNDVFIASEGASLGENTIWDSDEKIVLGQRLYSLRTNPYKLDPWFLAAYMQTEKFRKQINQISTGSTVFGVSQPVLLSTILLVPLLDKQKNIGKFYRSIKRRIELCFKIERELKYFLVLLYERWFMQFDFLNDDGKPYKTSGGELVWNAKMKIHIPIGWDIKKIGDILFEESKSKTQVNGATEKGKYPFFTSGDSILGFNEFFVDGFNIFLNTGGNPDIKGYKGKAAYSTDTWCVTAGDYSFLLYYNLFKLIPQFEQLFFAGSGLKHLQKNVLKGKYIIVPPKSILNKFNKICDLTWTKLSSNTDTIKELKELKDYLLPLLMNGQVTFK